MNKGANNFQPLIYALLISVGVGIGAYYPIWSNKATLGGDSKMEQIMSLVEKEYVDSVNIKEVEEAAIAAFLSSFDPHSIYIPAERVSQANQDLKGGFDGIGVEFVVKNDTPTVVKVIELGPAQRAGLHPGDRITKADTTRLIGLNNQQIISALKGTSGSTVELTIYRPYNREEMVKILKRARINQPSVVGFKLNDSTGYISIQHFAEPTYREFIKLIKDFDEKHQTGRLVLDLRNNPGGYLQTAIKLLNEFVDGNVLLAYTKGQGKALKEFRAQSGGLCVKKEVVCLVNEFSASASEIFSGAMQDLDRGLVVGKGTYGKGLVQETLQLNDGAQLRLTVARYYIPSGRSIQKPYNEDGYIAKEADSSGKVKSSENEAYFKTVSGRKVIANQGVIPDVLLDSEHAQIKVLSRASAIASDLIELYYDDWKSYSANKIMSDNGVENKIRSKVGGVEDVDVKNVLVEAVKKRLIHQICPDVEAMKVTISSDTWIREAVNSFGNLHVGK